MKKFFITLISVVIAGGVTFAQSMSEATEVAKIANEALVTEDFDTALSGFKEALAKASECGEEGAELVATCKAVIPGIINAIAKKSLKDKNYADALAKLDEAIAVAKEYGVEDVAEKAAELIPQAYLSQGSDLLKAKDFTGAVSALKKALDINPSNANAALYLGMALAGTGDVNGAVDAYKTAAANGQEANANKQIGSLYLKLASGALKNKDYKSAMENALNAADYVADNANIYKIAGTAAAQLKLYKEAAEYFSKYLEVDPSAKDAETVKANIEAFKKLVK